MALVYRRNHKMGWGSQLNHSYPKLEEYISS